MATGGSASVGWAICFAAATSTSRLPDGRARRPRNPPDAIASHCVRYGLASLPAAQVGEPRCRGVRADKDVFAAGGSVATDWAQAQGNAQVSGLGHRPQDRGARTALDTV